MVVHFENLVAIVARYFFSIKILHNNKISKVKKLNKLNKTKVTIKIK